MLHFFDTSAALLADILKDAGWGLQTKNTPAISHCSKMEDFSREELNVRCMSPALIHSCSLFLLFRTVTSFFAFVAAVAVFVAAPSVSLFCCCSCWAARDGSLSIVRTARGDRRRDAIDEIREEHAQETEIDRTVTYIKRDTIR